MSCAMCPRLRKKKIKKKDEVTSRDKKKNVTFPEEKKSDTTPTYKYHESIFRVVAIVIVFRPSVKNDPKTDASET